MKKVFAFWLAAMYFNLIKCKIDLRPQRMQVRYFLLNEHVQVFQCKYFNMELRSQTHVAK